MAQQPKYASNTTVAPEKSMMEIRALLKKHGAGTISIIEMPRLIGVEFIINDRRVRFKVTLPTMDEIKAAHEASSGKKLSVEQGYRAVDQMERSMWRGLLLIIKAKLEGLTIGIETFEEAFMAQLVLADNRTMAEVVIPQMASGVLMLALPEGKRDG